MARQSADAKPQGFRYEVYFPCVIKTMGQCTRAPVLRHHATLAGRQSQNASPISAIASCNGCCRRNQCCTPDRGTPHCFAAERIPSR